MKHNYQLLTNSIYYLLKIMLSILLVLFLVNVPAGFIFGANQNLTKDLILSFVFIICEIVALVLGFCQEWNGTKEPLKYYLLPCTIVFPIHFLISLWNGFYPYTSGMGVTILGEIITGIQIGNYAKIYSPQQVPRLTYILLHLCMTTLRLGAIVLAYYISRNKKVR